jgi:hypothetical protein
MRIERIAIMRISAGKIIGVFAHIERAEQHRAGSLHPRDERRILLRGRMIAIDFGPGTRDQAIHVKQVLDREGNTGKRRQGLALRARCINGIGAGKRSVGGDISIGIQLAITARDGCQMLFCHKACRDLTALHRTGKALPAQTAALAKEEEELFLYREMRQDMLQQILRRLAAVKDLSTPQPPSAR